MARLFWGIIPVERVAALFYYEGGCLRCIQNYNVGRLEGEEQTFDIGGRLVMRQFYKDGHLVGEREDYYPTGEIKWRIPVSHGCYNGMAHMYFKDGSIAGEQPYWDDNREGIGTYYDEGGDVVRKMPYHEDELHGVVRGYYKGKLFSEIPFEKGVRQGYMQYYDRDGKVFKKMLYVDDEYCGGKSLVYFGDGKLRGECDLDYDLPEGEELNYNPNGTLMVKVLYKDGMPVDGRYECFGEDGESTGYIEYRNNRGVMYDTEGNMTQEWVAYRNYMNGLYRKYDAEDGDEEIYFMDDEPCESKEQFLEMTFDDLAWSCARDFSDFCPENSREDYKRFFADAYERAMESDAAQVEYDNYAELKNPGDDGIPADRIVDYIVREFMLRLRLPNDGETERGIIEGLKALVKMV